MEERQGAGKVQEAEEKISFQTDRQVMRSGGRCFYAIEQITAQHFKRVGG
jgi:hypothetical protein